MRLKYISFPPSEWASVVDRLSVYDDVYTTRVGEEYGKYKKNDVCITPWKETLQVDSVHKITDIKDHPYHSQLTASQKKLISRYKDIEVIRLIKTYYGG